MENMNDCHWWKFSLQHQQVPGFHHKPKIGIGFQKKLSTTTQHLELHCVGDEDNNLLFKFQFCPPMKPGSILTSSCNLSKFVFNSITFSSLWYQYYRVISFDSLLTSFRSSTWCSFHVESQSPLHIITWSNLKNQLQLNSGIRLLTRVINSLTNLFSAVHCGRKYPSTPRDNFFVSMLDVRLLKSFHHFHGTTDVCASDRLDSLLLQLFVQRWQKWMSRY